jgi:hypothetical protein
MMTNSPNNNDSHIPSHFPNSKPIINQSGLEHTKKIFIEHCREKSAKNVKYLLSIPHVLEFDWSRDNDDIVTANFEEKREQQLSYSKSDKMVLWGCINLIDCKLYSQFKWLYSNFLSPKMHSHLLHIILLKYIKYPVEKSQKLYFVVGQIVINYKIVKNDIYVLSQLHDESLLDLLHKSGSLSPEIALLLFIESTKTNNKITSNWLYKNMYSAIKK